MMASLGQTRRLVNSNLSNRRLPLMLLLLLGNSNEIKRRFALEFTSLSSSTTSTNPSEAAGLSWKGLRAVQS